MDQGIVEQYDEAFQVTGGGKAWFDTWGIDCPQLERGRRSLAPICVDWSERKPHMAGALGAAVANRLFRLKWIVRVDGSRAVRVTRSGSDHLLRELGLEFE